MQRLHPSIHLLEVFMPCVHDERFFTEEIVTKIPDIPFYEGIEMATLEDAKARRLVRDIVEKNNYQMTTWISPALIRQGGDLSSLDKDHRAWSIKETKRLITLAAEAGATHCGMPCGPFKGEENLKVAMDYLFDSYCQVLETVKEFPGLDLTFEPLDRYAHKKMLLGPMAEAAELFKRFRDAGEDRIFIHWDSAHEKLAGIDLMESLELARPYLAQIHVCNCVTDKNHPCYGDWHMDLGPAPDYRNWGWIDLQKAVEVVSKVASFETVKGVNRTFVSIENTSHPGDDCWGKERHIREFLMAIFDSIGMPYRK